MGAEGDSGAGVVAGLVGGSFVTERYARSVTHVLEQVQISEGMSGVLELGTADGPSVVDIGEVGHPGSPRWVIPGYTIGL